MNRRLSHHEHARRLAAAMQSTTARYFAGCITRGTWKVHIEGLCWQIRRHGLESQVLAILEGRN